MARFARCDVRRGAAVFVGSDETLELEDQFLVLGAFRRLLMQIGGANIAARIAPWKPPTSSSLADVKRVGSFLLSTAARDPALG